MNSCGLSFEEGQGRLMREGGLRPLRKFARITDSDHENPIRTDLESLQN
jgi:hypothetical protein